MFLVGSLTTILPYLGTIVLMVVFQLVGTPVEDIKAYLSADTTKQIELQNEDHHSSEEILAAYYTSENREKSSLYPIPDSPATPSFVNQNTYLSRKGNSFSNKAPPHCVIS